MISMCSVNRGQIDSLYSAIISWTANWTLFEGQAVAIGDWVFSLSKFTWIFYLWLFVINEVVYSSTHCHLSLDCSRKLSINLSIYLYTYICIYLYIYLSTYLLSINQFIHILNTYQSISDGVRLKKTSNWIFYWPSISIYLSIHLYIYLSIHTVYTYLSTNL